MLNGEVWIGSGADSIGILVVSNHASLSLSSNLTVGFMGTETSQVHIHGAQTVLAVTNASGTSVFDIHSGTGIQSSGMMFADQLVVTNGAGLYEFNGGTATVGQVTIMNGQAFEVGNDVDTALFHQTWEGVTNAFADGVIVNTNGTFRFAGVVTNQIILNGGTLSGSGTLTSDLTVGGGSILSPGNSPGTQVGASMTWTNGGTYLWEINDFNGTVGNDPGWDWISLTGSLTITASAGNEFLIDIVSLDSFNNAGWADNFDDMQNYTLTILTALGGISGFSADAFVLDLSGFQNSYGGSWSISQSGNALLLEYQAIPEPSTWMLLMVSAALLGIMLRRKKLSKMQSA